MVKLTVAIQNLATLKLNVCDSLDRELLAHITLVSNRSLYILKTEGLSLEELKIIGKYLWRLFRVFQAYNAKKRRFSVEEIGALAAEFKDTFRIEEK